MLDIRLIRENPDLIRKRLATRGRGAEQPIDQLLELDKERRRIIADVERLKSERNALNKQIGARKAKVVELRFSGGPSVEESAGVLKISPESFMRDWKLATAWLMRELSR